MKETQAEPKGEIDYNNAQKFQCSSFSNLQNKQTK